MKKLIFSVLFGVIFMAIAYGSLSGGTESPGKLLYDRAKQDEQTGAYISANKLYIQAQPLLRQEGNIELGKECRQGLKRTAMIVNDYSATEKDIRDIFKRKFTGISKNQINYLISRVAYLDIEGKRYYFNDYINTVSHIDFMVMKQLPEEMKRNHEAYSLLEPFVKKPGPTSGSPYQNPISYKVTANYNIPRNELPQKGVLQIWQPVAINTDCQTDVTMISVIPENYVKNPASINGNLGDIYLEVPLDNLTKAMRINLKFKFKHFEQRFTMINPSNVGTYNKNSALYKEFTASGKNIFISPEIAAKAREVVAGEQNPYLAARKIYDYVVTNLTYSHVPHASIAVLNIPESVFVHDHHYGDCGSQSMYFAALCRAVGIPARAVGGYQLFPGMEGTHFWAEFYLPNYGWVPVDTSVAQIYQCLPNLTEDQEKVFRDYFFGSMDPYRMVIQKDVDYPFVPPVPEPTMFSTILQLPAVLCDTINGVPEEPVLDHYSIKFKRIV